MRDDTNDNTFYLFIFRGLLRLSVGDGFFGELLLVEGRLKNFAGLSRGVLTDVYRVDRRRVLYAFPGPQSVPIVCQFGVRQREGARWCPNLVIN